MTTSEKADMKFVESKLNDNMDFCLVKGYKRISLLALCKQSPYLSDESIYSIKKYFFMPAKEKVELNLKVIDKRSKHGIFDTEEFVS